jgi:LPS sulfotransferase NodH
MIYAPQFEPHYDFPNVERAQKTLLICSTPRSGSHALGHALFETGALGAPFEYANPVNYAEWQKITGQSDLASVFNSIVARRTSPNGIFSMKLHYDQLGLFGDFADVQKLFPNLVVLLLTRKNLLQQAVSMSLAHQTGQCIVGQEANEVQLIFKAAEIDAAARLILKHNALWEYTLLSNGIQPLRIAFEDFLAAPENTVRSIAAHLGVQVTRVAKAPVTKAQTTDVNREWCAMYLKAPCKNRLFKAEDDYGVKLYPKPSIAKRLARKAQRVLLTKTRCTK